MYGNLVAHPVAGFPAYAVSADGLVWTSYCKGRGGRVGGAWRTLTPTLDRQGYRIVRLYGEAGAWKQRRVCRLVCEAFFGPPKLGQECRHLDGNPWNDHSVNLAWGTSAENKADQKRHGTAPLGQSHHNATLTDAQVAEIRALKGKMLQRQIAAKFGITQGYVSELHAATAKRRITYKELTA